MKEYKITIGSEDKTFISSDINTEYPPETNILAINNDTDKSEKRQKKLKLIPELLNHMTAGQVERLLIKYGEITTNEPIDFKETFSTLFDKIKEIANESVLNIGTNMPGNTNV